MSRKNALTLYLAGTLGQIWIVCAVIFVLRNQGICVDFTTPIGAAAIGIGGISSALWGIVISVKYKRDCLKHIVKEFFNLRQRYSSYLLVLLFLGLDFCCILFGGNLHIDAWYTPALLFLKAILFGGIEVIGFTAGLLVNCFILSALYAKTNSLWICVMTHSLINVFSQIGTGGNPYVLFVCRIVIIMIAIAVSKQESETVK